MHPHDTSESPLESGAAPPASFATYLCRATRAMASVRRTGHDGTGPWGPDGIHMATVEPLTFT